MERPAFAKPICLGLAFSVGVLATGCSPLHPEEREAITALQELGADIELSPDGRAIAIDLEKRPVQNADLVHLKDLQALESLNIAGTEVTDAGLVHLQDLPSIRKLDIGGGYQKPSKIGDAGLAHLGGLHTLEQLVLSDSQVSDAGLEHFRGLTNLRSLYLFQTDITDAGLAHLEGLKELQILRVGRTGITPEGAAAFQAKMPNLTKFVEPSPDGPPPSAEPAEVPESQPATSTNSAPANGSETPAASEGGEVEAPSPETLPAE